MVRPLASIMPPCLVNSRRNGNSNDHEGANGEEHQPALLVHEEHVPDLAARAEFRIAIQMMEQAIIAQVQN
ncbi:hypothetical protein HAX54_002154 [Datura stramonium]|uniref:Uncharacterized protein n=1 Tax=Datura stramonium TaxID=4076 RepID=A0ABS8T3I0_DATST|nr:hypothetical protein [Datura stramonium]